jgi:hypothetical protein
MSKKDLPLTRSQAQDLAAELLGILKAIYARTTMVDATWQRHEAAIAAIISREPPKPEPTPYEPVYANDEELARRRAAVAAERSGERLRQTSV